VNAVGFCPEYINLSCIPGKMTMCWVVQGLISGKDMVLFYSPKSPDWLWCPHNLLFNGYWW